MYAATARRNFSVSSASIPPSSPQGRWQGRRRHGRLERLSRTRKKLKFVRETPPQVVLHRCRPLSPRTTAPPPRTTAPPPWTTAPSPRSSLPRRKSNPLPFHADREYRDEINRPIRALCLCLSLSLSLIELNPPTWSEEKFVTRFSSRCDRQSRKKRVKVKREPRNIYATLFLGYRDVEKNFFKYLFLGTLTRNLLLNIILSLTL